MGNRGSILAGGELFQKQLLHILENSAKVSLQNVFLSQELTIHLVSLGGPGK